MGVCVEEGDAQGCAISVFGREEVICCASLCRVECSSRRSILSFLFCCTSLLLSSVSHSLRVSSSRTTTSRAAAVRWKCPAGFVSVSGVWSSVARD